MKSIFSVTTKGAWWKGELHCSYNLLTVVKLLAALLALALLGFGLYWFAIAFWTILCAIGNGISWCASACWSGICWVAGQWLWLLLLALLALIVWLLSKVNWKGFHWPERQKSDKKRSWNWLWWLLAALIALLLLLLLLKGCGNDSADGNATLTENVEYSDSEFQEVFDEAFDWVVISRAYLDGVQNGVDKMRALVGLKFVDGRPVTETTFAGKTYDQAKAIIAADWRGLVRQNLHVKLTKQQLVVVTLFAMRNGKYGFEKSDFLKAINSGVFDANNMALHKANGKKRALMEEGLQYMWVLKILWNGYIPVEELIDYPMFSYKAIKLTQMYDADRNALFNDSLKARLQKGGMKTPRQALEL